MVFYDDFDFALSYLVYQLLTCHHGHVESFLSYYQGVYQKVYLSPKTLKYWLLIMGLMVS